MFEYDFAKFREQFVNPATGYLLAKRRRVQRAKHVIFISFFNDIIAEIAYHYHLLLS